MNFEEIKKIVLSLINKKPDFILILYLSLKVDKKDNNYSKNEFIKDLFVYLYIVLNLCDEFYKKQIIKLISED